MKKVSDFRCMSGRMLTAAVCVVAANDAQEPIDIELPLTVGMWDKTKPVEVSLVKGKNVLTFSRRGGDNVIRGSTIRDFTLTPVTIGE